jgi:hypothetical protein
MMDAVQIHTLAPTAIEYYHPNPGEFLPRATMSRWYAWVPKIEKLARARTGSTSAPIDVVVSSSPELDALERLRQFKSFKSNWDGEQSVAPNAHAIDSAISLLSLLAAHGVSPKVMLNAEGSPLLLINRATVQGEIAVTSANTIEFYFDVAGGEAEVDVHFDGKSIPPVLLTHLRA